MSEPRVLVIGLDPYRVPGSRRAPGADDLLELSEKVVNLVRLNAPDAAIALNAALTDSVDAAARWLS